MAVDQGYALAQNNLALCYQHGLGVPHDRSLAYALLRTASDKGQENAKRNVTALVGIMTPAEFAAAHSFYCEFKDKERLDRVSAVLEDATVIMFERGDGTREQIEDSSQ